MRMKAMAAAAAMMLAAGLTGCDDPSAPEVTVKVPDRATDDERALLAKAMKVLVGACPAIVNGYGSRYTRIEAELPAEPYPFMAEQWGWTRMVYVEVHRDDGHVLHYALGGGAQPGMLARKPVSHAACGLNGGQNDIFKAIAELGFLDDGEYVDPLAAARR